MYNRFAASILLLATLTCLTGCVDTSNEESIRVRVARAVAIAHRDTGGYDNELPLIETLDDAVETYRNDSVFQATTEALDVAAPPPAAERAPVTTPREPVGVRWSTNLTDAVAASRKARKPLMVHVICNGCAPCVVMERTVFSDKRVIDTLNRDWIPVKINASEDVASAAALQVNRAPTDVLMLPNQTRVVYYVGTTDAKSFLTRLQKYYASVPHGPKNPPPRPARPQNNGA